MVRKFGKSHVIENFFGRSEKAFLANLIPLIFIIYFFLEISQQEWFHQQLRFVLAKH